MGTIMALKYWAARWGWLCNNGSGRFQLGALFHCSTVPIGSCTNCSHITSNASTAEGSLFSGQLLFASVSEFRLSIRIISPTFPSLAIDAIYWRKRWRGMGSTHLFLPWNLPPTQSHTMLIEFHTDPLGALGQLLLYVAEMQTFVPAGLDLELVPTVQNNAPSWSWRATAEKNTRYISHISNSSNTKVNTFSSSSSPCDQPRSTGFTAWNETSLKPKPPCKVLEFQL